MKIKVRFFGRCRELVGKEETEVDVEEGATVGSLCLKLAENIARSSTGKR